MKKFANKDKLKYLISQFTKGILDQKKPKGMCFAVSCALSGYLNFLGYRNTVVEGEIDLDGTGAYQHYWLRYGFQIIDPTANQFKKPNGSRMPKIYVGKKPEWYKEPNA